MKKFALSNSVMGLILLNTETWSNSVLASGDFQNELGLFSLNSKKDGGDKITQTELFFQHYFSPVTTQGKPLNEAAFIDRSGSVGVIFSDNKFNGSFDATSDIWAINTILAKKGMPWMLELTYLNQDGKFTAPQNANLTSEYLDLIIGYFVADKLLVAGQYGESDAKASNATGSNNSKRTIYDISVKWLQLLSTQTAFNLEASIGHAREKDDTETNSGQEIGISGDYYFTPKASAGLLYSKLNHDDKTQEGSLLGITATYFATPQFFITATAGKFDAENTSGEDDEQWDLLLAYRF